VPSIDEAGADAGASRAGAARAAAPRRRGLVVFVRPAVPSGVVRAGDEGWTEGATITAELDLVLSQPRAPRGANGSKGDAPDVPGFSVRAVARVDERCAAAPPAQPGGTAPAARVQLVAVAACPPPPPPLVLSGHAASPTPY
jgi:hypothetical protein